MKSRLMMAVVMLGIVPGVALSQERPAPAEGLRPSTFPTAYVIDDRGVETRGKLLQLDKSSVVLLVEGAERRFDLARVNRVSRRGDSLKNGAIIGAVVGVLMGALTAGISDCKTDDGWGSCGAGKRVAIVAVSTGMYSAMGTGIDAAIQGRTVLYQAPTPGVITRGPAGRALSVRLTW